MSKKKYYPLIAVGMPAAAIVTTIKSMEEGQKADVYVEGGMTEDKLNWLSGLGDGFHQKLVSRGAHMVITRRERQMNLEEES